jgi:LAO/AO transport system kinase
VARRAWSTQELAAGVVARDGRAIARAISVVENREPVASELIRELYPRTGHAVTVGVTGSPGVGKSSLIGALVRTLRDAGSTVGVVSVDPSSPFTHGALLGDRIRLADHFLDPGVYIRSMGTRGHVGGLSESALQTVLLLDAAGYDVVFVETVGAGQGDVAVLGVADVVLLVLMPGSGDSIQALKAGIMEIPDVIAVNKRDLPSAAATARDVRSVAALDPDASRRPEVVLTEALRGEGVPELWEAVRVRHAALQVDGRLAQRRSRNLAEGVLTLAATRARIRIERAVEEDDDLAAILDAVRERRLDPLSAAAALASSVLAEGTDR